MSLKHIAIIPDGNRRWAKQHKLPTNKGHEAGFETLRQLLKESKELGINVLSFYAFSTENFNRSEKEVTQLFGLLENVLEKFSKELKENNIQLRISGSKQNLSPKLLKKLEQATNLCSTGDFILNICFNYGAQEEWIDFAKFLVKESKQNNILEEDITKGFVQQNLWTGDLPPVDLMIRTSGEYRISNFMLWQCAYAEFYFNTKLWPDFTINDLKIAIEEFHSRQRRYGS